MVITIIFDQSRDHDLGITIRYVRENICIFTALLFYKKYGNRFQCKMKLPKLRKKNQL